MTSDVECGIKPKSIKSNLIVLYVHDGIQLDMESACFGSILKHVLSYSKESGLYTKKLRNSKWWIN